MICRMILPEWVKDANLKKVVEGEFAWSEIERWNKLGYNAYYLPNHPKRYEKGTKLDGTTIDSWKYVFVDYDLKSGKYDSNQDFIDAIKHSGITPSKIVNSGHGVHVYWEVSDLDALAYLKLQKRLIRMFCTDESVWTLFQLMRIPGTMNTKIKDAQVMSGFVEINEVSYTCEDLDKLLPSLELEDAEDIKRHLNKDIVSSDVSVSSKLPIKFGKLLEQSILAKELFLGKADDRSKNDFKLAHLLRVQGFTKEEAVSVLLNTEKAMSRHESQRYQYAIKTIDNAWSSMESELTLSRSVDDLLAHKNSDFKGKRFYCHKLLDNTQYGFRLGKVLGLVGGSGIGKTSFALNMFKWCSELNPEYEHFFVSLEQPALEIAERWNIVCQGNTVLNKKVHIIDNYNSDGTFRNLSLEDIKKYIIQWKEVHNKKVGCVVIDHMGILKHGPLGLQETCNNMKPFAVQTDSFLIMQSQTTREKSGIGDLELNKDAAYGTSYFEYYCDFLLTIWQPLKRMHQDPACPTVTAFKYCKIRVKKPDDVIKEDLPYFLHFDPRIEQLRQLTQDEKEVFGFFSEKCLQKRLAQASGNIEYHSVPEDGNDFESDRQSH